MVKTPRTRNGAKKPPATIDLAADESARAEAMLPQPDADSPETRFAAQESLTPSEDAPPASLLDAGQAPSAEAAPAAMEQADTFRFPGEAVAAAPPAAEARSETEERTQALSGLAEQIGAQPGDASTPLFADPPPSPADDAEAASVAPPPAAIAPAESRTGAGRFVAAGFIGGALALLLAGLLQYFGTLPSLDRSAGLDTAALRTEIEGLRTQMAELREAGSAPNGETSGALDSLRADVTALRQAGDGAAAGLADRLGAVEGRVEALGNEAVSPAQIASLSEQASAARAAADANGQALTEANGRIEALEGRIAAMEPKVNAVSEQPRIALALAASGLKEAAERGVPFEAELATLAAIRPDLPEIAELQPLAAGGVPTLETIRNEWGAAAEAMVAAGRPGDADAGVVSRLWSSATGLVSVRPVGAVEGTSADAVIARMDAAVGEGDLAKALGEYDTLPDAVKSAGAAWAEKARALDTADRLIDRAIAGASKAS